VDFHLAVFGYSPVMDGFKRNEDATADNRYKDRYKGIFPIYLMPYKALYIKNNQKMAYHIENTMCQSCPGAGIAVPF